MSLVRERFIKIIEALPYDIQQEIYKKKTFDILKDVTQLYFDTYGTDDLSDDDKSLIQDVLNDNYSSIENRQN